MIVLHLFFQKFQFSHNSRPNLADDLVRARLKGKGDEEMENTHLENENSPSQTLEMLQYLEQESRGFNDYYTFKYVYSDDEESFNSKKSLKRR